MSLQEAYTAFQAGDFVTARQFLEQAIQADPNNEAAWVMKMIWAESPAEGEAAMRRVLEINPQNPQALQFQQQIKPPVKETPKQDKGEGTFQMLWDCNICSTKGLLGLDHRFCPHCGAQQNPDLRYYPDEDQMVRVEDHQFYGEDVVCAACQTLNAAKSDFCQTCGAPLTEGARAQKLAQESRAADEKFRAGQARDLVKEKFEAEMARIGAKTEEKKKSSPFGWMIGAGVLGFFCLCIVLCLVAVFWRSEEGVEVTGHSWERVVPVEVFRAVSEGDWCSSMPSAAYSVSRSQRQNGSRQVPDGETCRTVRIDNGDGTFSQRQECTPKYRSEPIYEAYCEYTIDKWVFDRDIKATGESLNQAPAWPQVSLRNTGNNLGAEREGEREEVYIVHLRNTADGKKYECKFEDESRWRSFPIESRWTVEVGVMTGSPDCDSLKRQ